MDTKPDVQISDAAGNLTRFLAVSPYGETALNACPLVHLANWQCLLTEDDAMSTLEALDAMDPSVRILPT